MSLKSLLFLQQQVIDSFDTPTNNDMFGYDLIEHPELLEDQFHHYSSMIRQQTDQQDYYDYAHGHGY